MSTEQKIGHVQQNDSCISRSGGAGDDSGRVVGMRENCETNEFPGLHNADSWLQNGVTLELMLLREPSEC